MDIANFNWMAFFMLVLSLFIIYAESLRGKQTKINKLDYFLCDSRRYKYKYKLYNKEHTYIIINRIRQLAIVIENKPSPLPALKRKQKFRK